MERRPVLLGSETPRQDQKCNERTGLVFTDVSPYVAGDIDDLEHGMQVATFMPDDTVPLIQQVFNIVHDWMCLESSHPKVFDKVFDPCIGT